MAKVRKLAAQGSGSKPWLLNTLGYEGVELARNSAGASTDSAGAIPEVIHKGERCPTCGTQARSDILTAVGVNYPQLAVKRIKCDVISSIGDQAIQCKGYAAHGYQQCSRHLGLIGIHVTKKLTKAKPA